MREGSSGVGGGRRDRWGGRWVGSLFCWSPVRQRFDGWVSLPGTLESERGDKAFLPWAGRSQGTRCSVGIWNPLAAAERRGEDIGRRLKLRGIGACQAGGETPQISAQWRLCASTTWLYNLISYWRGRVGVVSDCCCCTNHRMARFIQPASVLPLQSREAPPLPTFDS